MRTLDAWCRVAQRTYVPSDSLRENLAWWAVTRRTLKNHKTVKIGGWALVQDNTAYSTPEKCTVAEKIDMWTYSVCGFFTTCFGSHGSHGFGINAHTPLLYHCKKYSVRMTTSAWLVQFQGSLNRLVVWLRNSKSQLSSINPLIIFFSFKELAQTLVSNPTSITSQAIIQFRTR